MHIELSLPIRGCKPKEIEAKRARIKDCFYRIEAEHTLEQLFNSSLPYSKFRRAQLLHNWQVTKSVKRVYGVIACLFYDVSLEDPLPFEFEMEIEGCDGLVCIYEDSNGKDT